MTDSEVERPTFSHVSIILLLELEATRVKLLMITLIPFVSELFMSTANVLEPSTLRLVSRGSPDVKDTLFPSLVHACEFEFAVVQVQVTGSPEHTVCLSQTTKVVSAASNNNNIIIMKYNKMHTGYEETSTMQEKNFTNFAIFSLYHTYVLYLCNTCTEVAGLGIIVGQRTFPHTGIIFIII